MGGVNVADKLRDQYRFDHWPQNFKRWWPINLWGMQVLTVNEYVWYGKLVVQDIGVINEAPLGRYVGGICTRGEDLGRTELIWIFGSKVVHNGGKWLISRLGGNVWNIEEAFMGSGCSGMHVLSFGYSDWSLLGSRSEGNTGFGDRNHVVMELGGTYVASMVRSDGIRGA